MCGIALNPIGYYVITDSIYFLQCMTGYTARLFKLLSMSSPKMPDEEPRKPAACSVGLQAKRKSS
jgi:hypothetical protein